MYRFSTLHSQFLHSEPSYLLLCWLWTQHYLHTNLPISVTTFFFIRECPKK